MSGTRIIGLRFPSGGVNRRQGYQSQPPFTTVDAQNVRPDSVEGHRERGGSRPGTGPSHRGTLGSGNPVRLLAPVDVIETTGLTYWQDTFEGSSLGSVWSQASWLSDSPDVTDGSAYADKRHGQAGVVRSAFSPTIDTTADYVVEVFISPHEGRHTSQYRLFCRMDNSSPNVTTAGVSARLALAADGAFSGELTVDGTTTHTFTSGTDAAPAAGWFTLKISADNVSAYWRNSTLISSQAVGTHAGQRVGFSAYTSVRSLRCLVDAFRVQHYQTGRTQRDVRRVLMSSAGGMLYKEGWLGDMTAVSSSLTLASDRTLCAQQRLQKLYIADCGDWKASGTDGVRGSGNTLFDAASVSDWTTKGIDTDDDILVIYNSTGSTVLLEGVYKITTVAAGELTLSTDCATASGAQTCSWYITRSPKVYDYAANTLAQWTATTGSGFVPPTQPIVCMYRDRILMGGGSDSPHLWYMSRQGDPLDWDYGQTDEARAIAGQNSSAGRIGEPITAIIPHGDQCVVFGCRSSCWILRGDPASAGQIDNLSHTIGFVDKHAWCYVPLVSANDAATILFLSLDGIYILPAGCGTSEPTSVSREKIPEELLHVDAKLIEVQMAYDFLDRGVHIWLTKRDNGNSTHWWMDWETKGFFRVSVPDSQQPTCVCEHASWCAEDSCVILGGRDGKLRRFHKRHESDDGGVLIDSYVDYGPVMLGDQSGFQDGILAEISPILSPIGGRVKIACRGGASAQQARDANSLASSIHDSRGASFASQPRLRGNSVFLRLSGVDKRHWTVENIMSRIEPGGRQRVM